MGQRISSVGVQNTTRTRNQDSLRMQEGLCCEGGWDFGTRGQEVGL